MRTKNILNQVRSDISDFITGLKYVLLSLAHSRHKASPMRKKSLNLVSI